MGVATVTSLVALSSLVFKPYIEVFHSCHIGCLIIMVVSGFKTDSMQFDQKQEKQ